MLKSTSFPCTSAGRKGSGGAGITVQMVESSSGAASAAAIKLATTSGVAGSTINPPVKAGDTFAIDYRLYWQDDEPHPTDLARVVATRIGRGGVPGQPVPRNRWKFVIDFAGGPLATMAPRYDVKPVLTLSQGEVHTPYVVKVVGTDRWRAFFDVALQDRAAIDMRCYLRLGDRTLSETWLYQFYP